MNLVKEEESIRKNRTILTQYRIEVGCDLKTEIGQTDEKTYSLLKMRDNVVSLFRNDHFQSYRFRPHP